MESIGQIVAAKKHRAEEYKNTMGVTPSKTDSPEWIKLKAKVNRLTGNYPEYFKKRWINETSVGKKRRYEVEIERGQINNIYYLIKLAVYEKIGVAVQAYYVGFLVSQSSCYIRMLVDVKDSKPTIL